MNVRELIEALEDLGLAGQSAGWIDGTELLFVCQQEPGHEPPCCEEGEENGLRYRLEWRRT